MFSLQTTQESGAAKKPRKEEEEVGQNNDIFVCNHFILREQRMGQ